MGKNHNIAIIIASNKESSILSIVKSIISYSGINDKILIYSVKYNSNYKNKNVNVHSIRELYSNIKQYNLVHCHGAIPISLIPVLKLLNSKLKIISTEHDYGYDYFKNTLSRPKAILLSVSLKVGRKFCDLNCYPSNSIVKKLKNKISVRNYMVVINGINDPMLNSSIRQKQKKLIAEKRVVAVGNYYYPKGIDQVLCVAHRMPDFEFHFFGNVFNGYKNPEGYAYGKSHNNLIFHGLVKSIDLLEFLNINNSIVLIPSRFEVCPLTLLEAISTANPVVVSDIDANKEFAKSCFSREFSLNDPESLFKSIKKVFNNYELLAKRGRKYFESHYTDKIMAAKYLTIYKSFHGFRN